MYQYMQNILWHITMRTQVIFALFSPVIPLSTLFHHQIATCTVNVKFREETVDLLPGTSSGK